MIYLCGRKVRVFAKTKTQTVNICTEANTFGDYDYVVRMQAPNFVSEHELLEQSFTSLEEVLSYLIRKHRGQVERRPSRLPVVMGEDTVRVMTTVDHPVRSSELATMTPMRSTHRASSIGGIYVPASGIDDWRRLLADPQKHWRTGYSAKMLAQCWQEAQGFPPEVTHLLATSGVPSFARVEFLLAFPEYQVALPGGRRPSQNDLFVLGKALNQQLIALMVEGKVAESFGPRVKQWLSADGEASAGKRERLAYLVNMLKLPAQLPGNVRYQLLHRTASAVIEAMRFNAKYAIMLVHSFSPENRWFEDYAAFARLYDVRATEGQLVHLTTIQGIELYAGWARGNRHYLG